MLALASENVLDVAYWSSQGDELREKFNAASPFPHLVLDNFLPTATADALTQVYHEPHESDWYHYTHFCNKTSALPNRFNVGEKALAALNFFTSDRYMELLKTLTGISGLMADNTFEAGGFMEAKNKDYLKIHADYTVHPFQTSWQRRLNVLMYLDPNWKAAYGGNLELWSSDMKRCVQSIEPRFNRAVIFATSPISYHGFPDPLTCPDTVSRKCLGLYYYTQEATPLRLIPTQYKIRPQEKNKALVMWVDQAMINTYTWLKKSFGISDRFASNLMKWFK